jgi:predicted GTPase
LCQFLNQLLETAVFEVGVKLASCTQVIASHVVVRVPSEYAQLNRLLNGRRIVLVDTPGFDDTYMGDEEILSRISEWLTKS